MANRARELNLDLSDDMIKAATTRIKNLADQRTVTLDQACGKDTYLVERRLSFKCLLEIPC
jgi:hypothetical protein